MDTDLRTTETECDYCGKGLSRRGRGSHQKTCPRNPGNAASANGRDITAERVRAKAEEKVSQAREIVDAVRTRLESDPRSENDEAFSGAAHGLGEAERILAERDGLLEILAPARGGRRGA